MTLRGQESVSHALLSCPVTRAELARKCSPNVKAKIAMQLDPNKRYLLSRPCGGLNDILVQIEKSRLYAQKYGRVLLLDASRSGLHAQLDTMFTTDEDFGCEIVHWNDDMITAFDSAESVLPHELRHRISSYVVAYDNSVKMRRDTETKVPILFNAAHDHAEQVLVYEQSGGGFVSFQLLKRLKLRPELAETILRRIEALGSNYDAVHIRHSDYRTKFAKFLKRLRPALKRRRVLMCSDSVKAKDAASRILHSSTEVLSVSDIPDTNGKALHRAKGLDVHENNIDLLSDLFALSAADSLFFSRLNQKEGSKVTVSGFSLLANMLHCNRGVVKNLFSSLDPKRIDRVLDREPRKSSLLRRLRLLDVYRWNFEAKRKAASRNRSALVGVFEPERLPPKTS